ncbi:MAG TPA: hypothetical protein VJ672_11875 [Gemmatimonadaceae bacterium]|nr:hypothetical protein [Gemmatimonadaceae bacterium]
MRTTAAEAWVEAPVRQFVDEARVTFALLLHPTGQVLAQYGFTSPVDVMSACALASAIHASAAHLGRQLDGRPFTRLFHADNDRRLFLGETITPRGALVFLTVFGAESSAGLVLFYFRELARQLAAAAPPPATMPEELSLGASDEFEHDLQQSLAALFGPEPVPSSRVSEELLPPTA